MTGREVMSPSILICSLGQGNFTLCCGLGKIGHKVSGTEDAFNMRKEVKKMGG